MSVEKGLSTYSTADAQPTGQLAAGGGHKLILLYATNNAGSVRWLKIYDKATAPASTDTPKLRFLLPANTIQPIPIPFAPPGDSTTDEMGGVVFTNGIGFRCTTGYLDSDTGAPTAGDVQVNLFYH